MPNTSLNYLKNLVNDIEDWNIPSKKDLAEYRKLYLYYIIM